MDHYLDVWIPRDYFEHFEYRGGRFQGLIVERQPSHIKLKGQPQCLDDLRRDAQRYSNPNKVVLPNMMKSLYRSAAIAYQELNQGLKNHESLSC